MDSSWGFYREMLLNRVVTILRVLSQDAFAGGQPDLGQRQSWLCGVADRAFPVIGLGHRKGSGYGRNTHGSR